MLVWFEARQLSSSNIVGLLLRRGEFAASRTRGNGQYFKSLQNRRISGIGQKRTIMTPLRRQEMSYAEMMGKSNATPTINQEPTFQCWNSFVS
jgi:hypothetical protein